MAKITKKNPRGAGRKPKYGENMKPEIIWLLDGEKEMVKRFLQKIRLQKYGY